MKNNGGVEAQANLGHARPEPVFCYFHNLHSTYKKFKIYELEQSASHFRIQVINAFINISEYFNCGHLAALPNIPIVEKSVMLFNKAKFLMNWSRNETDEEKIKEGHELRRLHQHVLNILKTEFQ